MTLFYAYSRYIDLLINLQFKNVYREDKNINIKSQHLKKYHKKNIQNELIEDLSD